MRRGERFHFAGERRGGHLQNHESGIQARFAQKRGQLAGLGLVICSMRRSEIPASVASATANWSAAIASGWP